MSQEKVWDVIAMKWDKFRVVKSPTVEKFVSDKKGKILDVGCGSGRNFMKTKGLSWSAVDFSSEMIELAKEKANNLNMKVEIFKSDSTKLPFDDETFDAVLCFAVIHCIDGAIKRKKTIEEIYRVLKSGGEALISSWGPKSPRLKNKEKECFVPWTVKEKDEKQLRYTYVFELDELVELVKSIGFEVVNSWEERNVNVTVRKPNFS